MKSPELLTLTEAADLLELTVTDVRDLIRTGRLASAPYDIAMSTRIPRQAIHDYLARMAHPSGGHPIQDPPRAPAVGVLPAPALRLAGSESDGSQSLETRAVDCELVVDPEALAQYRANITTVPLFYDRPSSERHGDRLDAARGLIIALAIGLGLWTLIIAAAIWIRR